MNLLSIDGGGIKGLYAAVILDLIEKEFDTTIAKHVDVISGTSIGGIIALAIAAKKTPSEIVEFFWLHGSNIFPSHWFQRGWKNIKQYFFARNSNIPLSGALKEFFGDEFCLGDITGVDVCIPTVNLRTGKVKVFKTPHHSEIYLDSHYKVWEVALATAAAPCYLPIAKISSPRSENITEFYVDGGLWANNPSLVAMTEALTYSNQRSELESTNICDLNLLSVGNITTGMGSNPWLTSKGFIPWNTKLIQLPLNNQCESTANITKLLFERNNGEYLRIQHHSDNVPKEICLDRADTKTMQTIEELALNDIQVITSVAAKKFFSKYFNLEMKHGQLS